MPVALPDHVRLASVDGDLVFLDTRRNSYSCVVRSVSAPILSALSARTAPTAAPIFEALVEAGLLVPAETGRTWAQDVRVTPDTDFHQIGAGDLPIRAATLLKLIGAALVGWVQRLRPRPARWFARRRTRTSATSLTRAATLALQFDRLRPLLPDSGGCLASSIMLLAYLRFHGIDADWVFGVRTFPFEAHCWVERDGVVLNDIAEHVAWFTPIASC